MSEEDSSDLEINEDSDSLTETSSVSSESQTLLSQKDSPIEETSRIISNVKKNDFLLIFKDEWKKVSEGNKQKCFFEIIEVINETLKQRSQN